MYMYACVFSRVRVYVCVPVLEYACRYGPKCT